MPQRPKPHETNLYAKGLARGQYGRLCCWWCANDPLYELYHDSEWGVPTVSDQRLFEKICLEGFQSGLSWLTILRKREGFRDAFRKFDFRQVAEFTPSDVDRLVGNAAIVRHRAKISSTVNNARRACEMVQEYGSLAAYFWQWEPPSESRPAVIDQQTLRSLSWTAESAALAKDLKKRGWSFVGPTTAYAFMQAMGLVNDHVEGCWRRPRVAALRSTLAVPSPGCPKGRR